MNEATSASLIDIWINASALAFSETDVPFAVAICRVAIISAKLGDDVA